MEKNIGKRIRNNIITIFFLIIIVIIILIISLKISFFRINGTSMSPTLDSQELVLAMPSKKYKRGDIIAFDLDGVTTIKRIIGIPGDKVFITEDGTIYLNNKELQENYLKEKYQGDVEVPNPYEVAKGEYYVLGDNRKDSKDSRLIKVSGIKESEIKSKVIFSISKLKRIK